MSEKVGSVAARAALVGVIEIAVGLVWYLLIDLVWSSGWDSLDDLFDNLFAGIFMLGLLPSVVVGAGLVAGWLLKLPRWGLVVPVGTGIGLLMVLVSPLFVGLPLGLAAIAGAGALAASLET